MSTIDARFIKLDATANGVSLGNVPDSADNSRKALTNAAQSIVGVKTFSSVPKTSGTPTDDTDFVTVQYMAAAITSALVGLKW